MKSRQPLVPRSQLLFTTLFMVVGFHDNFWTSSAYTTTRPIQHSHPIGKSTTRSCDQWNKALKAIAPESNMDNNDDDNDQNENNNKSKQPIILQKKRSNFRMQLFSKLNLPIVEVFSILAVLLSCFLVALNTLDDLPPEAYILMNYTLETINIIFALDFFVRWYAAGQFKFLYLTKPLAVIDIIVIIIPLFLLSIIPFFENYFPSLGDLSDTLQNSAGLQNLLLLRLLRIRRVLTEITTFGRFAVALGLSKPQDIRPYQLQMARVLLSIFTLLSVSSGLIYSTEHAVNEKIPDYFAALYFGLTTLTTVGFGDIAPVTTQGRLVVCGSILVGVAIIPTQLAELVNVFIESQKDVTRKNSGASSLGKRKTLQSSRNMKAVDGKGPSGVPLETLPNESVDVSVLGNTNAEKDSIVLERTCGRCGASPHRYDALFCWSCGWGEL